ncbi:MAG: exodeoxyribonuclease VII small subunit [Micrococcales bacterium]|nr:exodeoxyribonuclease VII small subunit [Micrococcales bacterium]
MADAPDADDGTSIDNLTYEEARALLAEAVERLESGEGTLEESIAAWEAGEALATRCQALLDNARQRLDQAMDAIGRNGAEGDPEPTTTHENE